MRYIPVQAWASRAGLLTLPPRQPVTPDGVAVRLAIGELFARYGIAHDEVDHAAMVELFAEDAELKVSIAGPPFETHHGAAAIAANFGRVAATQSDQRRHAITNIETAVIESGRAQCRAYGIVSAADAEGIRLVVSCAYEAECRLGGDGLWRFSKLWIGMDTYRGHAPGTD
ncbi:nuclear transport factor 2 family protein [Martelella sp. HB161492]|uniref:nuclear transport factor 2 family protein n=1 Tax=Martelella sp. HB161492 TaxID=2720726 RepID=UPI0015903E09|nr:nuclear transport factor 2 family protein [Martelella sp. HB161492]